MADEYITVVHKITNMAETVPRDYYEELKEVFRPITKKQQAELDKSKLNPELETSLEEVPEAIEVANELAASHEAQEGAK